LRDYTSNSPTVGHEFRSPPSMNMAILGAGRGMKKVE
jgi:hypothetical protein